MKRLFGATASDMHKKKWRTNFGQRKNIISQERSFEELWKATQAMKVKKKHKFGEEMSGIDVPAFNIRNI